jgi:hypothetical protein
MSADDVIANTRPLAVRVASVNARVARSRSTWASWSAMSRIYQ